jgi:hypothetical protein
MVSRRVQFSTAIAPHRDGHGRLGRLRHHRRSAQRPHRYPAPPPARPATARRPGMIPVTVAETARLLAVLAQRAATPCTGWPPSSPRYDQRTLKSPIWLPEKSYLWIFGTALNLERRRVRALLSRCPESKITHCNHGPPGRRRQGEVRPNQLQTDRVIRCCAYSWNRGSGLRSESSWPGR